MPLQVHCFILQVFHPSGIVETLQQRCHDIMTSLRCHWIWCAGIVPPSWASKHEGCTCCCCSLVVRLSERRMLKDRHVCPYRRPRPLHAASAGSGGVCSCLISVCLAAIVCHADTSCHWRSLLLTCACAASKLSCRCHCVCFRPLSSSLAACKSFCSCVCACSAASKRSCRSATCCLNCSICCSKSAERAAWVP